MIEHIGTFQWRRYVCLFLNGKNKSVSRAALDLQRLIVKSNYLHQHNSTHVLQVFTSASASKVKLLFVSVFCFSLFFFLCNLFLSSLFVYLHTCSFGWLVGRSVGRLVGWLVGRLFDCLCACTECMFYIFNFLVHTFTLDKICIAIVCICVQTFMCMSRGFVVKTKA